MNNEQAMKMTELDQLTAAPNLQMIKAALPYIHIPEQQFFSLMVKITELRRTIGLFTNREDGKVGICSLDEDALSTPIDMLNAMKPYGTEEAQEMIDMILNFAEASQLFQTYQAEMESEMAADDTLSDEIPTADIRSFSDYQHQSEEHTYSEEDDIKVKAAESQEEEDETSSRGDSRRFPIDQLINMLPPEQQSRMATAQMLMQTFQQFPK